MLQPHAPPLDGANVEQLWAEANAQRHEHHAVVDEVGQGGHEGALLSSALHSASEAQLAGTGGAAQVAATPRLGPAWVAVEVMRLKGLPLRAPFCHSWPVLSHHTLNWPDRLP